MIVKKMNISEIYPQIPDFGAYITTYFTEKSNEINFGKRPAIVIFPGGGYWFTSDREADPIALKFASEGYQVAIVRYSTKDKAKEAYYPQQILEGFAAINYIRDHADELNVDINKVAVIGFSAGGHMAGMMGTLYGEKVVTDTFGKTAAQMRPDAMVLSYAVLSSGEFGHRDSFWHLLGDAAAHNPEMRKKVDVIENVTKDTPPAFLWTTFNDDCVPAQNSIMMATKMLENGVPCELHMYHNMGHGASLCNFTVAGNPDIAKFDTNKEHVSGWIKLCMEWLREQMNIKF